jgi:sugar/nucleoside kinase (ribokinase family)
MIVCCGHAAYDLNVPLPEFPAENRKYLIEALGESSGGPAANAASLLARWGHSVSLAAPLGDDPYGHAVRRDLAADGVELSLLETSAQYPTPLSVIIANLANGSRTIVTRRAPRPPLVLNSAALAALDAREPVTGLVFDGHEPEASLVLLDRYPDAFSVLDAGTLRPGTELLARRVTHLVASEAFTNALATRERLTGPGAGLTALCSLSSRWVAFTQGEHGCRWYDPATRTLGHLPALPVRAVDTTGAGDIFHGAFAYGLALSGNPVAALQWGTAAAGLSVQVHGGRSSIPTLADTRAALADRPCLPTRQMVD